MRGGPAHSRLSGNVRFPPARGEAGCGKKLFLFYSTLWFGDLSLSTLGGTAAGAACLRDMEAVRCGLARPPWEWAGVLRRGASKHTLSSEGSPNLSDGHRA